MFGDMPEGRERKSLSPLRRGVLMNSIAMDCASLYTTLVRLSYHVYCRGITNVQMFVLHSLLLSSLESLDSFQTSSISKRPPKTSKSSLVYFPKVRPSAPLCIAKILTR